MDKIEEYQKFCNEYEEKIEKAYNCVLNNPCNKVVDEIESIIEHLEGLKKISEWNDSNKTVFDENVDIIIKELNTLNDNINTSWKKAEILYRDISESFENFKSSFENVQEIFNNQVNKDDYREEDEFGTISYPGYREAYSAWKTNYDGACSTCDIFMSGIETNIKKLKEINNSIFETYLTVSSLGTNGKKIGNIDNYKYYMSDEKWKYKPFYKSGGTIIGNGCSLLAASVSISVCLDESITPLDVNKKAAEISAAGPEDRSQFIIDVATAYDLNTNVVDKSETTEKEEMLQRIADGESVATVRIAPNKGTTYYTDNGHFINIVGYKVENGEEMVLVHDSGHKSEPQRSGWHPLSEIESVANSSKTFIEISANDIPTTEGVKA